MEGVLQVGQLLIGKYFNSKAVLHLPATLYREDTLVNVSCHKWMYIKAKTLDTEFMTKKSIFVSSESVKSILGIILPVPPQVGHVSSTLTSITGRTR